MSYIIISNIGMAVIMLLIYFRYTHFRLKSKKEVEQVKKNLELQIAELKKAENNVDTESLKAEAQKVESLQNQIKELERQCDSEVKLRNNAEKQIDVTNKKMQELEKRIEDWSVVQDAIMSDSRDSIIKIGNDLFKKLNDSYKQEVETNRNLIGRVIKAIEEQKGIISNIALNNSQNNVISKNSNVSSNNQQLSTNNPKTTSSDPDTKKLLDEIIETMKAAGKLANKDYFTLANFDEQKGKLFLCELVFVDQDCLYIIDFKAVRYFSEYEKLLSTNQIEAQNFLKEKLEKYLAYLSNPKYVETILKVLGSVKISRSKTNIVLALPSKKQITITKDLQYFDNAKKMNIEIMDFDLIVNIVI